MFLLKNGKQIPKIGLGTYLVKGEQMTQAVDAALKVGYRSFDTAKFYENEQDLGQALKELLPKYKLQTEDIFLTTKVFPYSTRHRDNLNTDLEQSFMLLERDYIDLVLVHYPRPFDGSDDDQNNKSYRKDVWQGLTKLYESGKVGAIGVSNYEIKHIEEMREYSDIVPHVNQVEYHPHFQRTPLKNYCQENGILFQAFSPLGRQNSNLLEDEKLLKIAHIHQTSTAQVILSWALNNNVAIVPKSITPTRIEENFKALNLKLSNEEVRIINEQLNRDQPYVEDNDWLCS